MLVTNSRRTTAIVVKNAGGKVTLVPMSSGKLVTETLSFAEFRLQWREVDYSLARALETFLQHADEHGATAAARNGLQRLAERDRLVDNLFEEPPLAHAA